MENTMHIEGQVYKGYGYGFLNSKIVFVPFVCTNETIKVEIVKDYKNYSFGKVTEILKESNERRKPFCKYFGECGGCAYQHLRYKDQLEVKDQILKHTLKKIAKIEFAIVDIIPDKQTFYRHRVRFQKSNDRIGFFKQNSNEFLAIDYCPILLKKINKYIASCANPQSVVEVDSFGKLSTKQGENLAIDLSLFQKDARLFYKMGSFAQANLSANQKLIDIVLSLVDSEEVFEAFCGIGNFTVPLALRGHHMVAFDIDERSIKTLRENAKRLSLPIKAYNQDLEKPILYKKPIDTLILDPPRGGAKSLMNFINSKKPRKVIYVSCEPPTLARDLSLLKNYFLKKIFLIDMFAGTYHFETVAVLYYNK